MPETVLIVEDEPEFSALVELWVGRAGYRTATARTGPDALRRFYDARPDLVILDVALPGLDGWQLLERLREFSRVPIIMVTARGSESEKIRIVEESLSAPRLASATARRHGISNQLLFAWRKAYREGRIGDEPGLQREREVV